MPNRGDDVELKRKFDGLADAWDHVHGFKFGSKVDRKLPKGKLDLVVDKEPKRKPHVNQWHLGGLFRMAFASLGKSKIARQGMDGTTHGMAGITVTASIGEFLQLYSVDKWLWPHGGTKER